MSKEVIHFVYGTHWDREWYQPFQSFRFRLVEMFDEVLSMLDDDPEFRFFMDGQTLHLLDYLEIRPEQKEKLQTHIDSSRFLIGPWYVMPDERNVSGEALIRNLLQGSRISGTFNTTSMKYGYICDMFGHIAQLPQIFNEFGIRHSLLGRGTNPETHQAHFIWEGADDSQLTCFRLPDIHGYGMFQDINPILEVSDFEKKTEEIEEKLRALYNQEKERSPASLQLWLDAHDHCTPKRAMKNVVERARSLFPDADVRVSSLPEFAADQDKYKERYKVWKGEITRPSRVKGLYTMVLTHSISSYYPLKQENDSCQVLLERISEPLSSLASISGKTFPKAYIQTAWEYLLKNQFHDDICGCSVAQVHKDMEYRFDQCRIIAEEIAERSINRLLPKAGKPDFTAVHLYNPLPYPGKRVVTVDIFMPEEEQKNAFRLEDATGKNVPYQLHATNIKGDNSIHVPDYHCGMKKQRISFETNLPGMGFTSLKLIKSETPLHAFGTQRTAPLTAENEHLRCEINPDGTINLTNLADGNTFSQLLYFEDSADCGDGYRFTAPVNNQLVYSPGSSSAIRVIEDGQLVTTFRILTQMRLPECFDRQLQTRSEKTVATALTTDITLRKGSREIEVNIKVDNNAKDHRMRLIMPSGIAGNTFASAQPFTWVKRPRGVDQTTQEWKEADTDSRSFLNAAAVCDNKKGLALLAGNGLHEIAVADDNAGTIALTLFRSTEKTVSTAGEERGQLQRPMEFQLALKPLTGKPDFAAIEKASQQLTSGIRTRCRLTDNLPDSSSFLEFKDNALFSTLKPAEDGNGSILRVYNPTADSITETIVFSKTVKQLSIVQADESPINEEIPMKNQTAEITLAPQKVKSFRLHR